MKRIWGVVVGALLLATGVAGYAATKSEPSTKMEVRGTIDVNDVSPGSALEVACAKNDEHRTSDLCAQWKAADAARDAANWGLNAFIIGTFVNLLTLVGVALGWIETKKSADAAQKQLALAQATTDTNARAWLGINSVAKGKFIVASSAGFFIDVICTNHGDSPAMNVWVDVHLGVSNENRQAVFDLDQYCAGRIGNSEGGITLMPGEVFVLPRYVSETLEALDQQFAQVSTGANGIPYCYVCATYTSPHAQGVRVTGQELLIYKKPDDANTSVLHFDFMPQDTKNWRGIMPLLERAKSSVVT